MGLAIAFAEEVTSIRRQVPVLIDLSGRPGHLDDLDAIHLSQSEMEPRVGGRLVASSADPPANLATPSRVDDDTGADGVAIR